MRFEPGTSGPQPNALTTWPHSNLILVPTYLTE